jgi:hypothetical protein
MSLPLAEIVAVKELWQTVVYSIAAAVGVAFAFSLSIYGAARSAELRRDDRPLAAGAAGGLMALGLIACAAALVLGFVVMTSK